jgi:hypothetical protein
MDVAAGNQGIHTGILRREPESSKGGHPLRVLSSKKTPLFRSGGRQGVQILCSWKDLDQAKQFERIESTA